MPTEKQQGSSVPTPDQAPVIDPDELPLDTPAGPDGNDRDNDLPEGDEKS